MFYLIGGGGGGQNSLIMHVPLCFSVVVFCINLIEKIVNV